MKTSQKNIVTKHGTHGTEEHDLKATLGGNLEIMDDVMYYSTFVVLLLAALVVGLIIGFMYGVEFKIKRKGQRKNGVKRSNGRTII